MSSMIPAFFNKSDFWAMLLPGYITLILGILLFYPVLFTGDNASTSTKPGNTTPDNKIQSELFTALIFIVAGPCIGFILSQIYFHLSSIFRFLLNGSLYNIKYSFEREYGSLRLLCTDPERQELDSLDGRHKFGALTAIGLGLIGAYTICIVFGIPGCQDNLIDMKSILCITTHPLHEINLLWLKTNTDQLRILFFIVFIFAITAILATGSFLYNQGVRLVVICRLMQRYGVSYTTTCLERENNVKKKKKKKPIKFIEENDNKLGFRIAKVKNINKVYGEAASKNIKINYIANLVSKASIFDYWDTRLMLDELIKEGILKIDLNNKKILIKYKYDLPLRASIFHIYKKRIKSFLRQDKPISKNVPKSPKTFPAIYYEYLIPAAEHIGAPKTSSFHDKMVYAEKKITLDGSAVLKLNDNAEIYTWKKKIGLDKLCYRWKQKGSPDVGLENICKKKAFFTAKITTETIFVFELTIKVSKELKYTSHYIIKCMPESLSP